MTSPVAAASALGEFQAPSRTLTGAPLSQSLIKFSSFRCSSTNSSRYESGSRKGSEIFFIRLLIRLNEDVLLIIEARYVGQSLVRGRTLNFLTSFSKNNSNTRVLQASFAEYDDAQRVILGCFERTTGKDAIQSLLRVQRRADKQGGLRQQQDGSSVYFRSSRTV